MEERISGFRVEGDWEHVVAHGDRISQALQELGSEAHPRMEPRRYREALHEFDHWRPRAGETIEEDIRPRTAEQASLHRGEGEQRGRSSGEDLESAGEALVAPDSVAHVDESVVRRVTEASRLTGRALDTGLRGLLRSFEESIYEHLMTRTAPCYFDNRIVSANLAERQHDEDEPYEFEIDINADELKEKVGRHVDQALEDARRHGLAAGSNA
jgi:hypothetical protein